MEHWFQNTRGLVIVVLASSRVRCCSRSNPATAFPPGSPASSGGDSATVDHARPPRRRRATTTTCRARPTLQVGTPDSANTMILQQRLATLGYDVGTPDGNFGPGTEAAVIAFQTDKGISPADGVVNQATWNALLADPTGHDHHDQAVTRDARPGRRRRGRRWRCRDGGAAPDQLTEAIPASTRSAWSRKRFALDARRRPGRTHREVVGEGPGHRAGDSNTVSLSQTVGGYSVVGSNVVAHDRSSLQVPMNDCKEGDVNAACRAGDGCSTAGQRVENDFLPCRRHDRAACADGASVGAGHPGQQRATRRRRRQERG